MEFVLVDVRLDERTPVEYGIDVKVDVKVLGVFASRRKAKSAMAKAIAAREQQQPDVSNRFQILETGIFERVASVRYVE